MIGRLSAPIDMEDFRAERSERFRRNEIFFSPSFSERDNGRMLKRQQKSVQRFVVVADLAEVMLEVERLAVWNFPESKKFYRQESA